MNRNEREKGKKVKFHSYYDFGLLFLTLFLAGFGLLMIYSTSGYNALMNAGDEFAYVKKQLISVLLGVAAMFIISRINYRVFTRPIKLIRVTPITLLFILCIFLQIIVLFVGREVNGAKRWIDLGPLGTFQPSELSKVGMIMFTAYIVQLAPQKLSKFIGFLRICLFTAPLIVLVVIENLSTAIVLSAIMGIICFVASRKKLYYFIVGMMGLGAGAVFVALEGYRLERFDVWHNIETHEKGYQILQGLYAIASGGLFGVGLGQSMQKLGFIPESHNDMIFSVICEELGLVGAIALIIIFVMLLWRLLFNAINAPDLFGGLICMGILTHIAVQVLINIAVVTNTIPSTGIPLPFISYGGTSVAIILAEMGLALSVSNQIKYER